LSEIVIIFLRRIDNLDSPPLFIMNMNFRKSINKNI